MPTKLPTNEHLKEVVRKQQVEHREAKQRQEHEESAIATTPVEMA